MKKEIHFCTFNESERYILPEGFTPAEAADDFGIYVYDPSGALTLAAVNPDDERISYEIAGGTEVIAAGAFSANPVLSKIFIPAGVRLIEDGALSNAGGWADDDKGIREVCIDSGNEVYFTENGCVYERLPDKNLKLMLYFDENESPLIRKEVTKIAEKAFFGSFLKRVTFEATGHSISFPNQPFHNEELLLYFGKESRLYDFTLYDGFLMRNHFSPDRLRMICERINVPVDLTEDQKAGFYTHIRGHFEMVFEQLIKHDALETLMLMAETGIFNNKETTDEAIEAFSAAGASRLLKYMIGFGHEKFGEEEFDFSI